MDKQKTTYKPNHTITEEVNPSYVRQFEDFGTQTGDSLKNLPTAYNPSNNRNDTSSRINEIFKSRTPLQKDHNTKDITIYENKFLRKMNTTGPDRIKKNVKELYTKQHDPLGTHKWSK